MSGRNMPVRTVADTALWVAYFRALETERPDAIFRDPYAKRLAGERGFQIAKTLRDGDKQEWVWTARTYLCDQFLSREISQGADLVLNLAAGLDARPYRMDLPESLRWVEVDLPDMISYKEEVLAKDEPKCRLERIALDLSDRKARRELFMRLDLAANRIAVLAEGLLIYLNPEDVARLARDLSQNENFYSWIIDLASPVHLKFMQWTMGKELSQGGAALKFAPREGPEFFRPYGWEATDVEGLLKTAAKFKRSPDGASPALDEPKGPMGRRQWSGVCLFHKSSATFSPHST
jgi:methyltransferase (TIGR00027 family)